MPALAVKPWCAEAMEIGQRWIARDWLNVDLLSRERIMRDGRLIDEDLLAESSAAVEAGGQVVGHATRRGVVAGVVPGHDERACRLVDGQGRVELSATDDGVIVAVAEAVGAAVIVDR